MGEHEPPCDAACASQLSDQVAEHHRLACPSREDNGETLPAVVPPTEQGVDRCALILTQLERHGSAHHPSHHPGHAHLRLLARSEERRVGKACRSWLWALY